MSVSPNSRYLFTSVDNEYDGSDDNLKISSVWYVHQFDIFLRQKICTYVSMTRNGNVNIKVSKDNKTLIINTMFGINRVFKILELSQKDVLEGKVGLELIEEHKMNYDGTITAMKQSPCSKYLFAGSTSGHVKQWCTRFKKSMKDYKNVAKNTAITALHVSEDSRFLFIGTHKGELIIMNIEDQRVVCRYPNVSKGSIVSISGSRDGKWVLTCDRYSNVKSFDADRFCYDNSFISEERDLMVPSLIDYFSLNRDMNL